MPPLTYMCKPGGIPIPENVRGHFTPWLKHGRRFSLLAGLIVCSSFAQQPDNNYDLSQASLEDLMKMQVTSVSKKEQPLSKTGAAVFVITQEDIARSGATNIPDLLRMVPGVDVARTTSNEWAISIRGFNDLAANKVLVLIDGRSVYSPSFSGIFWDAVDVPLPDIDRIEVIRGPGGTVWGANAVNGVINIITKTASTTPGGLVAVGGGSETLADTLIQYGSQIGTEGSYRIFGKFSDVADSEYSNGQRANDGWLSGHAGFRSDWTLSPQDTLTVQGDFERTAEGSNITTVIWNALPPVATFNDPARTTEANVLARWNHTLASGSQMSLQVYDSYSHRLIWGFVDSENTVDADFQYRLAAGPRNDIVWGLGARGVDSDYGHGYALTIVPNHRLDGLFSGFLQDEIKLTSSLAVTVGTKLEHNAFTGFEYQPSAQLVWSPTERQTIWVSASRAVREPSSVDVGVVNEFELIPNGSSFDVLLALGNPHIKSEVLRDVEAGYRITPNKRFSLDLAAFDGSYRNLESTIAQTPYSATQNGMSYVVLPYLFVNGGRVQTYGGEFFANWNVTDHWRLSPGYSYLHMNLENSGPISLGIPVGTSPDHQFQIKSLLDLPHHLEWDNLLTYVSPLAVGNIPAYARLDSRLGWRVSEFVEASVVGQNLLTPLHAEFSRTVYPVNYTMVERSVFGRITWRF